MRKKRQLPVITDCKNCGVCCRHMGHPPFYIAHRFDEESEEYWEELPQELKDEVLDHFQKLHDDYKAGLRTSAGDLGEPCIWLTEEGTCRHYEHRPEVCSDFERGGEYCRRFRRDYGIDKVHDAPKATSLKGRVEEEVEERTASTQEETKVNSPASTKGEPNDQ